MPLIVRPSIRVAALLFGSGFCALVYQTVWLRQFRLIFGASTTATAAVLAIFMAGLGIGSVLLGRRADAKERPLAFYGKLELGIAFSAALTPLLLIVVRAAYVASGGSSSPFFATIVRLILSLLVLGVPTVLMGGTLPAAARAVEGEDDAGRRRLALLYGANTLGAVAGTIVSTFYLLEHLGNRGTLWLAAAVNVGIALIAIVIPSPREPVAESPREVANGSAARRLVFVSAFLTGFVFLVMELVWYRMLSPLLGGTTFMFGLILAVALAGIGIGGAVYSLGARGQATIGGFAMTCALEALAIITPFALGDELAMLAVVLRPAGVLGFGGHLIGWTIVTAIVVFPAAVIAGFQFPLLISLLGRGRDNVGHDVGLAYAWNTAGSIVGSLLGGFVLIPALSAPGTWQLAAFLLAALSAFVLIDAFRMRQLAIGVAALAVAVLSMLATRADGPTAAWRHSGIGASRFPLPESINGARDRVAYERRIVLWEADGRESSVALAAENDLGLIINGKADGSARGDAGTQVMGGMLPALLHPRPRTACVIGLGTGTTAGWLSTVPAMERVDVFEIEPVVVEMASIYAPVNRDVLRRPNVRIRIADAREMLLARPQRYDVIFSEPSNPYRAGIASLYTREFYAAARERLERGGIFAQWVQTYAVDATTIRTIYATMRTAFPHVETWWTAPGDLLLVATREPIAYDVDALRARLRSGPYAAAAHAAWRVESVEGVLSHFIASSAFAAEVSRGGALNTDDRTTIEFSFARSISAASFDLQDLFEASERARRSRPELVRGDVNWEAVADERASQRLPSPDTPRRRFAELYARDNLRQAGALFRAQPWGIVDSRELAHVAEALADNGDDAAIALAETHRAQEPIEADAILARLFVRKGRHGDAAAALERAFLAYRRNPWPLLEVTRHALDTAAEVVAADRSYAPRLFAALEKPFANLLRNEWRLQRRLSIAAEMGRCSPAMMTALADFEPHVPWQRHVLALRATCYSGEARDRAKDDLAKFDAAAPPALMPAR